MIQALALAGMILNGGTMATEVEIPQQPQETVYDVMEEATGLDLPELLYVKEDNVIVKERDGIVYLSSKEPKVIVKEKIIVQEKVITKYVKTDPPKEKVTLSRPTVVAEKVTPRPETKPVEKPAAAPIQKPEPAAQKAAVVPSGSGAWQSFNFTYYTATCPGCSGITATGVDVRSSTTYQGMKVLAVNPAVIPYWSIVEVQLSNGQSFRGIALDTGGKMRSNPNVIDVLAGSNNEAISNGVDSGKIRFIRRGKE